LSAIAGLANLRTWLTQKLDPALLNTAGIAFLIGIVLFSGSLYALSLSGIKILGAVAPLGGLAFIAGWVCLAIAAWRSV
jgi:uncharacterized membrane protein YgdD (TMEM256/DUF423 family)